MPKVYSAFDLPPAGKGTMCTAEEGKTRQSERESADVNLTIRKYNLQPMDLALGWSGKSGEFVDVSSLPDFRAAHDMIRKADEAFMTLPPEIRARFDNDPVVMLDKWNKGEMAEVFEEIGFLERLPVVDPPPAGETEGETEGSVEGQRRTADGRFTHDKAPPGGTE